MSSPPQPSVSSYEINLLIQHYLQELGYDHAAFAFAVESRIPAHPIAEREVPPGSLVYLVQKGIMYSIIEKAADESVQSPSSRGSQLPHLTSFLRQSEDMIQEGFKSTTWARLMSDPESQEHPIFYLDNRSSLVLSGHEKPVTVTIWSPDDTSLATGGADGRVVVWSYDPKSCQMSDRPVVVDVGGQDVTAMSWDSRGERLIVGCYSGAIVCYTKDLTELWRIQARDEPIVSVSVSTDSSVVAGDCAGKVIVINDSGSIECQWDLNGDLVDTIWGNGKTIIAAVSDTVYRLTVGTTDTTSILKARGPIAQVVLDSKREFAVAGDDAGYVTVITLATGETVLDEMFHENGVCSLAFAGDLQTFATGGRDGFVKTYDIAQKEKAAFEGHAKTVYAVACDKKAQYVVTAGAERIVNVWKSDTKQVAISFLSETRPVVGMAWSNNGEFLTIGLDNGDVSILDFSHISNPC